MGNHRFALSLKLSLIPVVCAFGLQACSSYTYTPPLDDNGKSYGAFLAGEWASQMSQHDRAAAYFQRAFHYADDTGPITQRLFLEHLRQGRLTDAADIASQLTDADQIAPLAWFVLGTQAMVKRDYDRAQRAFQSAGDEAATGSAGPILAAWAVLGQGDVDGAVAILTDGRNPNDAFALSTKARLLDTAGRLEEAEAEYANLARANLLTAHNALAYGQLLVRLGRVDEAEKLYTNFIDRYGKHPLVQRAKETLEVPNKKGNNAINVGAALSIFAPAAAMSTTPDTEVAIILLHMALRLDSKLDGARVLLGEVMAHRNAYGQATAVLDRVDRGSAYYPVAVSTKAFALRESGQFDAAIAVLNDGLEIDPNDTRLLATLADLYRMESKFQKSEDTLNRLLVLQPDQPIYWMMRGIVRERLGRWAEAEADLLHVVDQQPENAEALNYLGYSWLDRGMHQERATQLIIKAARLKPQSGAIRDSLGWAYFLNGDVKGALHELEIAAELEPGDPTVNHHLGDVYNKLGRVKEARWQWERALQLDPDDKERSEIESKLYALGVAQDI